MTLSKGVQGRTEMFRNLLAAAAATTLLAGWTGAVVADGNAATSYRLRGKVVDPDGQPLGGVMVTAFDSE